MLIGTLSGWGSIAVAEADDAAAADLDAGVADMGEGIEAVVIGPGGDDLAIELGRGIEVMIVVVEAGVLEPAGLVRGQHTEGDAAFHAERADTANHLADGVEVAVLGRAPGRPHAIAGRAAGLRLARGVEHGVDVHQPLGLDTGVVLGRLRAIGAVLRAAPGLDRQQVGHLHPVGVEMAPMQALRPMYQVVEGQREQVHRLVAGPVVAQCGCLEWVDRRRHVVSLQGVGGPRS
jgi:hypothetical protein